jgi:glyoxylase-like metal-dependent hydrolase (beta-lactamase superfamily II)
MRATASVAGVHLITVPTPFDVGPVNLYLLVDGDSLTLVDTGPLTQQAEEVLEGELHLLGYKVEDLSQIVLTHFHVDHTGMLEKLVMSSGAKVYAHPWTVPLIRADQAVEEARYEFFRGLYLSMGASLDVVEQSLSQLFDYQSFTGNGYVDVLLHEGMRLPGHEQWEVLYTPGHSQDHISLYRAGDGVMLLGDHLIRSISSNAFVEPPTQPGQSRPKTLMIYREALRKIQALPWQIGFSGHGEPIKEGQELIEKRLHDGERRAAKIVDLVAQGKHSGMEIALALFPRHMNQLPLIVSETLGHLDWMVADGVLAVEETAAGVWHYRTTEKNLLLSVRDNA